MLRKEQTETYGAYDWSTGLPNGILVLCDAFDQSDDDEVRSVIAKVLRHAFYPHVSDVVEDSKFVVASREWLRTHHAEFFANIAPWCPGAFVGIVGAPPQLFRRKAELQGGEVPFTEGVKVPPANWNYR